MKRDDHSTDVIFARQPNFTAHYRAGENLSWGSDTRIDYSLLVLMGGRLRWKSSDETGEISAGDALLAAPGEELHGATTGVCELLVIALSPVFVVDGATRARLLRSDAFVSFRSRAVRADSRLSRLARDLVTELTEETVGQELVIGAIIDQMLVHVLRRYANVRRSEQLELSRAGFVDRRIRRAVELMQSQLNRDLQLDEIAEAAHLSPFHFARLFKKLTGATPHAYLAALRITQAQKLLAETDLSIIEVGARVGYASPSHFAKAFKQNAGISPSAYRKALR